MIKMIQKIRAFILGAWMRVRKCFIIKNTCNIQIGKTECQKKKKGSWYYFFHKTNIEKSYI